MQSGMSSIYSAIQAMAAQLHGDLVGGGSNGAGGVHGGSILGALGGGTNGGGATAWTNGLTYDQWTNTALNTNLLGSLSDWMARNSDTINSSTGAVGASKSVFSGMNSGWLGGTESESPGSDSLLDVDLGQSVPHIIVRSDHAAIVNVGAVSRVFFAWLFVLLLYIKCIMWTMEALAFATQAPQARTAGQSVLGNNASSLSAFGMGVLIVAGIAVLPSAMAAAITTVFGGLGGESGVAALRPNVQNVMGAQAYHLLLKFFPLGVAVTCAINYPVAKVAIYYVMVVYSAMVRLLSGL
jgi:hypothetical protein